MLEMGDVEAWQKAVDVAFKEQKAWQQPAADRHDIVPGASHFAALDKAQPAWRHFPEIATIGDHTFFRVENLAH